MQGSITKSQFAVIAQYEQEDMCDNSNSII